MVFVATNTRTNALRSGCVGEGDAGLRRRGAAGMRRHDSSAGRPVWIGHVEVEEMHPTGTRPASRPSRCSAIRTEESRGRPSLRSPGAPSRVRPARNRQVLRQCAQRSSGVPSMNPRRILVRTSPFQISAKLFSEVSRDGSTQHGAGDLALNRDEHAILEKAAGDMAACRSRPSRHDSLAVECLG